MMKSRAEDGYVAERYMDHGIPYIRVKYKNKYRTEVIMQESVFEKIHGKFENEDAENIKRASQQLKRANEEINLRKKMEELLCIKNFY